MSEQNIRPGYKLTEVGVIPEDWEVSSVGRSFEIRNHLRLPLSQTVRERIEGPYPYYGPTGVQGNINEYRVEGEHALIGEDGDHFLKWRDHSMTLLVTGKFNVNNHAHLVRGTKNATAWFYWFFANRDTSSYLTRQGASRYKLTKATLLTLPCAIPPPIEQNAIATALSDVDALQARLEQLIAKKRDLKQAAMQQLITGQTRLPGFSGEWEEKTLGDVATIRDGTHQTPKYVESGIPFFSVEHVTSGDFTNTKFISLAEHRFLTKSYKIDRGDILMTRIGSIGDCKLIDWDVDASFYVSLALLKIRQGYSAPFISHYSRSAAFQREVELHSLQSAIPKKINLGPISNVRIALPSLPEQTAIATVLSDMDAEITALEARRDKARALKQAMMQELLTGTTRLVPTGAADA